jgi:DNA-binding transcriptional LysR family regulator
VVARSRRVQAELEALSADVASALGEVSGVVRVGVIGTTGRWLVPRLLTALEDAYPKVRLVVVDATTTSLLPQLAAGTLDLAVVNLPAVDPDVDTEMLFEEEHVLLVTTGHPFAGRAEVHLADLDGVPLLLEPAGTGFRDDLEADAARAGVRLTAQAEIDGMRLLASLAYQGYGAAILPASAVVEWTDGTWETVSLTGTTPRSVGLATPRRGRLSAPARATAEVLRNVVATEVPSRPRLHLPASSRG